MTYYTDGYAVEGKFSSNTGASSTPKSKKKYGYKGKKKTAPKETKNYGVNTNVKVRPDGTVKDDDNKAKEKAASVADLTQYVKDEKAFEKAQSVADLTAEVEADKAYTKSIETTTPTVSTTTSDSTPTVTPTVATVDPVDMSSGGDEEARYSSSASSPVSGTGGGQATDIEEIPDLPNKLRSAIRRRRTRKLGKRGLRNTSSQTGLNIPAGNSGLGIPT